MRTCAPFFFVGAIALPGSTVLTMGLYYSTVQDTGTLQVLRKW